MTVRVDAKMLLYEFAQLVQCIENALTLMLSYSLTPLNKVNRWRTECLLCLKTVRKELYRILPLKINQKRKCLHLIEKLVCLEVYFDLLAKKGSGVGKKIWNSKT